MRKLLIVDGSEVQRDALREVFHKTYEVTECADGGTAVELIRSLKPDVLILELSIPVKDGITVLREARDDLPGVILATTVYPVDYVYLTLMELGVGYIMLKPCDVGAIASHIASLEQLAGESAPVSVGAIAEATGHLQTLGVQSHLDGYQQLRVGIPLYAQDPAQNICKELYASVAVICGKDNPKQVERCMRSAIRSAWEQRDNNVWSGYFEQEEDGAVSCPSNKVFIARLAEKMA